MFWDKWWQRGQLKEPPVSSSSWTINIIVKVGKYLWDCHQVQLLTHPMSPGLLSSATSTHFLKTSVDGDSTASLSSLFLCTICRKKKQMGHTIEKIWDGLIVQSPQSKNSVEFSGPKTLSWVLRVDEITVFFWCLYFHQTYRDTRQLT